MISDRSWDWFTEPAPSWDDVGVVKQPAKQRTRKLTLSTALKEACRAGCSVKGVVVEGKERYTLQFGEPVGGVDKPASAEVAALDAWRAKRRGQG